MPGTRLREEIRPPDRKVFDSKKIKISETIEFLYHLFQFHGSTSSAESNMNANSTGLYHMAKLFLAVDGIQDGIVFGGRVWIDEKYVPVWKSAKAMNADGDAICGLSRNQLCICTATDGLKATLILCGTGQPTTKKALGIYSKVISPKVQLIRDGARCQRLIALRCSSDEVHHVGETKGLPDKRNPMEPVNRVHRLLEFFLKRHSEYKRENLLGCLNHFAYWYNTPGTAMEKAIKFIEMAVKKRKMLRYRAWDSKKKHDGD